MTTDDQKQLDELASQRRDVLLQRDRLQEELREVPAKLHLIEVRRKLIEDSGQATSGAAAGPAELESMNMKPPEPTK
ncbi:MAG: hypothetical protein IID44_10845 [Planctomycetes bacterium]|nr:hypothetical protein [Planctomycetota bacterium]